MNLFLGTFDGVLDAMHTRLPLAQVVSQKGLLRNLRLQARLIEQGVIWRELRNRQQFDEFMASIDAVQLCVVAGFSYILPQHFIDRCRDVINFHPGIIQRCRGPQPIANAILQGHRQFGITVHRIDSEQIDAGPILSQRCIDIDYTRGFSANHRRLKNVMAELAGDIFRAYAKGNWPAGEAWQADEAAYFPRVEPGQVQALVQAPDLARWG